MNKISPHNTDPAIVAAFTADEAEKRIENTKVGCALVVTLMPLGSTMDYVFYHDQLWPFFGLRLACSSIAVIIWALLYTRLGRQQSQWLGLAVPLLPVVFLTWIIAVTNGFGSTYYAALNLVLLAVGAVLHWTLRESIVAVLLALAMYVGAGFFHGHFSEIGMKFIFNNFYFIALMDVIVVVGTYFQSRARFREFVLRLELDKNRAALETSLTQLKENEAQLVQSEKLASLGRMSAGMIHEINNPLNFATTGLFTLRKKGKYLAAEQQADYADILKDVEEGVNRVKTIISDLRMFTHPDTELRDRVAVGEVVTAALRFLNNECKEKVEFEQDLPANQTIWANKNKLIHVLTNLLQNSLDAMKTKTFTDEKPTVKISGRMENGVSFLSVRDNGPGIAAANLDKIYDPFFTTKDVGEGMGLGLSIVYRIVREAKGKVFVRTEVGKFCEFTLEFPATEKTTATN
ncbi:MAG TPA: ATP-binding protein [Verrucomicrobiae bacterium]